MHILANLLPHTVLVIQLLARLQQLKARQELVHLQQLTELVEYVGIGQEIHTGGRTVFDE